MLVVVAEVAGTLVGLAALYISVILFIGVLDINAVGAEYAMT